MNAGRDELADARVVGRLEQEQAPALDVPERLPPRIERLGLELGLGADVAEVAAEPPVAQAGAHVGVAGDEPAVELLVAKDRRRLAERGERRIRVGQELRARVGSNSTSYSGADVLEEHVDAERDDAGRRHAQPADPEHPADPGKVDPPFSPEGQRTPEPSTPGEREGDESESGGDGNREARVQQLVALAEARQVDRNRKRGDRREAREE